MKGFVDWLSMIGLCLLGAHCWVRIVGWAFLVAEMAGCKKSQGVV